MSRFSKSAAEKAGWGFTHDADEEVLFSGGQQGVTRVKPASVRAEKYITTPAGNEQLITEEASTLGLLLERIHAYEEHQESIEPIEVPAPAPALVEEVKLNDNGSLVTTGKQVDSVTGKDVDSAALARDEENAKSVEPATDPEGEATPQVFSGEDSAPTDEDLDSMTKAELLEVAAEKDISVPSKSKKSAVLAKLKKALS